MHRKKNHILKQIKEIVKQLDPMAKIYLYGSRSKGLENKESDWDILILIDADQISPELEQKISHPLYDLEFDTGEVISPMIFSEKEWNTKYCFTSFYKNVMLEGELL